MKKYFSFILLFVIMINIYLINYQQVYALEAQPAQIYLWPAGSSELELNKTKEIGIMLSGYKQDIIKKRGDKYRNFKWSTSDKNIVKLEVKRVWDVGYYSNKMIPEKERKFYQSNQYMKPDDVLSVEFIPKTLETVTITAMSGGHATITVSFEDWSTRKKGKQNTYFRNRC